MTAIILAILGIILFALISAVNAAFGRALAVATTFAAYRRRLDHPIKGSSGTNAANRGAFAALARRVQPEPDPLLR